MPFRRIAPLAIGLVLAPCAVAQSAGEPQETTQQGHWYAAVSAAVVESAEFTYAGDSVPDLFDIRYTDITKAGEAIEASVGYAFSNGLRAEAAVTHQNFEGLKTTQTIVLIGNPPEILEQTFAGDRIQSSALNLNAYYDFPASGSIRPYVGLGAGAATVDVGDILIDAEDTGLSLQVMAGLSIRTSKSLSLYIEARWQNLSDLTFHTFDLATSFPIEAEIDFSTLSLRSGLRLTF